MKPDQLATPALVIDAETVQKNLSRMADYAEQHEFDLRPHTKTHKSILMGTLQVEFGALGLTVAQVGEAEVMAAASDDILMAYPAVDFPRTRRLAKLAMHKTVRVGVDSRYAAQHLAEAARAEKATIGILVDIDVGMGRTGVQTPDQSLELAQFVDKAAGLRLDGIMCYPGHIRGTPEEQKPLLEKVDDKLAEALNLWTSHGLQARIVSGGSTPTIFQSHLLETITELRPGTYIYNDMTIVRGGYCGLDDCAARIICTVVSTSVPGQIVIDAGTKTLTSDLCGPAPDSGHGLIVEYPDAKITKLTEEHGQVDVRQCSSVPKIGDRVTVIPNHICPCVNLQDVVWLRRPDGEVERFGVDARGKLS